MHKPVIIAGAGPVGLTLALLLHRQGRPVRVFESVDELKPPGVGINLLPHSVRVLYGPDGISSTARRSLYPDEGAPIYGGRILWRGVTEDDTFIDGSTMFMAGHQDCKFVAYPIAGRKGGRQLINWIAELSVPDFEQNDQDWNREVSIDVFKDPFQSWTFGWIDIPALIDNCEHVYEFPLSDRDPLPCWAHGNMTVVGDAAHPMYPIGSNGASQGILDAEKLAVELSRSTDIPAAFAAYEAERRPATAAIVLANRRNGPEQVMQIVEERAPHGFDDINDVISREELETIAAQYKQTAGFNVEAVNGKASDQRSTLWQ